MTKLGLPPKARKNSYQIALLLLITIVCFEILLRVTGVPPYLIPKPSSVAAIFATNASQIASHTGTTLVTIVGGFVLAGILGFGLAVLYVRWDLLHRLTYPFAVALQTTPVIAIATIIIVWFGGETFSHILIAAIVAFFPVLVDSYHGMIGVNRGQLDVFHCFAPKPLQTLIWLRVPSAAPRIFSGLEVAAVLTVVGAVVGEFTSANAGIGHMILVASYRRDTPMLFAYALMSAVIGLMLIGGVRLLRRRVVFWESKA